jgi:hypothetical protein
MEWVKVTYPSERDVVVDSQLSGKTNRLLLVGEGTHEFTLGLPIDYSPPSITCLVSGTAADAPLIIAFQAAP